MSVEREARAEHDEPEAGPGEPVEGERASVDRSPSKRSRAAISVLAFVAIVLSGAGIGVLRSDASLTGGTRAPASISASAVEPALDTVTTGEPPVAVPAFDPIEEPPVAPEPVENIDEPILPEVAGVLEESLAIEPKPPVILELPKPLYDRFDVSLGDSISANIVANDVVGGVLESVRLTGWGELAPGFVLAPNGTLSGTASECGDWQAQYELISDNPASGSSFIDITVRDCVDEG